MRTLPSSVISIIAPVVTVFKNSSPKQSIAITFEFSKFRASNIPLAARLSICSENKNAAGFIPMEQIV